MDASFAARVCGSRANTGKTQREGESGEHLEARFKRRRWLAPPAAYPTTQEIKPVDDANDEPRKE